MNCKPGDLAYVVGSRTHRDCNGMVVEVVSLAFAGYWNVRGSEIEAYAKANGLFKSGQMRAVCDAKLRAIRDNDGTDETLTWAPKREGVTA